MATTTSTETSPNDADPGQLKSGIDAALTSADATAADRVANLGLVMQARVARLTRASASATAQYGAGSAQATAAQAVLADAKAASARVSVAQRRAATAQPQVGAGEWAFHGRVYDDQLQPVAGHTVFMVDSQNNYESGAGFAYTDATGYFLLSSPAQAKGEADQAAPPVDLFLSIVDEKGEPVYRASAAFRPAQGAATYQEVTLSAKGTPIGDPPATVRRTAFPRARQQPPKSAS